MSKIVFKKLQAMLKRIPGELENVEVQAGWLGNVNEENGTPVAYVATIHEFGSPAQGIPPRPMLEPTMQNNKDAYIKFLRLATKQVQNGDMSGQDAMDTLGELVRGDIQKTITEIKTPALKPETIKRKGFDKPLIDSSTMINAVTHEVVKK